MRRDGQSLVPLSRALPSISLRHTEDLHKAAAPNPTVTVTQLGGAQHTPTRDPSRDEVVMCGRVDRALAVALLSDVRTRERRALPLLHITP
jgi:hypothetical protein